MTSDDLDPDTPNEKAEATTKKASEPPQLDPERLARDREAVRELLQQALNPAVPRLKSPERQQLKPAYPDPKVGWGLIMEALGISDFEFLEGLLQQLIELCSPGTSYVDVKKANFVLSIIKSIAPRDPIEVMLAFQMAEIQMALTTATHASTFQIRFHDMQLARAMLSKLARVYTLQMEALRRHRNGGEHKITVQYINVSNGGQAIVGDVTHAPRGQRNKSEDTPKALAEASMAPMAATAGLSKHRRSACHTRPTRKNSP